MSRLVQSGRYSKVRAIAGGMVYCRCLRPGLEAADFGQVRDVHERIVMTHLSVPDSSRGAEQCAGVHCFASGLNWK